LNASPEFIQAVWNTWCMRGQFGMHETIAPPPPLLVPTVGWVKIPLKEFRESNTFCRKPHPTFCESSCGIGGSASLLVRYYAYKYPYIGGGSLACSSGTEIDCGGTKYLYSPLLPFL
jgi:hypothetical protein